jgi:hypothetical protein
VTEEELDAIRTIMRQEIGTALAANEQRMNEKFTKIRSDLEQVLTILNGTLIRINEMEIEFFDSVATINKRIDLHENTSVGCTHPLPGSPYLTP